MLRIDTLVGYFSMAKPDRKKCVLMVLFDNPKFFSKYFLLVGEFSDWDLIFSGIIITLLSIITMLNVASSFVPGFLWRWSMLAFKD